MRPRPGRGIRRRPPGTSRAARLLRDAPVSRCDACGRMTATTTDGACAECWARKDAAGWAAVPAASGGLPSLRAILRALVRRRR